MSSIIISPKDPDEFQFIKNLLEKLGVKSKVLSDEAIEDLGMSLLMKETDRSERVAEIEILNKLKGK